MSAWFTENLDVMSSVVWILLAGYQSNYCFVSDKNDEFWRRRKMSTRTMLGFYETIYLQVHSELYYLVP